MLACIGSLSDSPPNLKCPVYEFGHHMYDLTFMPVVCAVLLPWLNQGALTLGVGQNYARANIGPNHAILPGSSRSCIQQKSPRPHAPSLDFGLQSTYAILPRSKTGRKCRGRADFGWGGNFFDPRNLAWVEQNLAPARFGSTQGPGQGWPRADVGLGPNLGPQF